MSSFTTGTSPVKNSFEVGSSPMARFTSDGCVRLGLVRCTTPVTTTFELS